MQIDYIDTYDKSKRQETVKPNPYACSLMPRFIIPENECVGEFDTVAGRSSRDEWLHEQIEFSEPNQVESVTS